MWLCVLGVVHAHGLVRRAVTADELEASMSPEEFKWSTAKAYCDEEALGGCVAWAGRAVDGMKLASRLLVEEASVANFYQVLSLVRPSCAELCLAAVEEARPVNLAPPGTACGDASCKEQVTLRRGELVPAGSLPSDDDVPTEDSGEYEMDCVGCVPEPFVLPATFDELLDQVLSLFGVAQLEMDDVVVTNERSMDMWNQHANEGYYGQRVGETSAPGSIAFGASVEPVHHSRLRTQRRQAQAWLDTALDRLESPDVRTAVLLNKYMGDADIRTVRKVKRVLKSAHRAVSKNKFVVCKPDVSPGTFAYVLIWRTGKKGDRNRQFIRSEKFGRFYVTHVCPAHWHSSRDAQTQTGTLVVEAAHHAGAGDQVLHGRKAFKYDAVLELAKTDSSRAQQNAQNFRYLVWDLVRHA